MTGYIKLIDGQPQAYTGKQLRDDNPNVSFPRVIMPELFAQFGVFPLVASEPPAESLTHKAVEDVPVLIEGEWVQQWTLVPRTPEELSQAQTSLQAEITAATQQRLDAFARTRNYDGILSACTYATSTIPQFQTEGQYCVDARDATWAALYGILAEVQAGTRPAPTGFADIETELPQLEWPA